MFAWRNQYLSFNGGETPPSPGDPYWNNVMLLLNQPSKTYMAENLATNNTPLGTAEGVFTDLTDSPYNDYPIGCFTYQPALGSNLRYNYTDNIQLLASGDWTIELWVKFDANPIYATNIFTANEILTNSYATVRIYVTTANRVDLLVAASSGTWGFYIQGATISNNTWNHIAVTRQGTSYRLFNNGVITTSTVWAGTPYIGTTYQPTLLGNGNPAGFVGMVKHKGTDYRMVLGTALYTSNFSVPTQPLENIPGTEILVRPSGTTNRSTTNWPIDRARNIYSNSATTNPYSASGGYFNTYNSLAPNYTAFEPMLTVNSRWGYPNQTSLRFGTNDFTIEFWMNCRNTWNSGNKGVMSQKSSDTSNGWQIFKNGTNPTKMTIRLTVQNDFSTNYTVPTNEWVNYAITKQGNTYYWYVNGILDNTMVLGSSYNISDTSGLFYIGAIQVGNWYLTDAQLYNIRISNTCRYPDGTTYTPSTVPYDIDNNTLYASDHTPGLVNKGNAIVPLSTQYTGTGYKNSVAYSRTVTKFDGYDSISINNENAIYCGSDATYNTDLMFYTSDFTFEFFVNFNFLGTLRSMLSKGSTTTGFDIRITAANQLEVVIGSTSYTDTETFTQNQWYFISVTRSSGIFYIHIDGIYKFSITNQTTYNFSQANSLVIGASRIYTTQFLNGYMDQIRITKDIARYGASDYTVPTEPFPNFGV